MSFIKEILIIVFTACINDNIVLVRFLGVCPFLGITNRLGKAMSMSLVVGICMVLSSVFTWPVAHYILIPRGLEYLETVTFLFIIGGTVALAEAVVKRSFLRIAEGFGGYLPLIASDCAVLWLCRFNAEESYGFVTAVSNAVGAALGFSVAVFIFAGIRERIERSDIPESFKGLPASLIAAGIVSLSFVGFTGLSVGLFGM